jgi:23S rRNA (cytosine1962-C5)-methyltransferase
VPTPFRNRLAKNVRHFDRWAGRRNLTAYRVYDRDIPEFPFVVERYAGCVHLVEYPSRARRAGGSEALRAAVLADVVEVLGVPPARVFSKTHLPRPWGRGQATRLGTSGEELVVEEQGLRFWVNLSDRLDTGLFLDHRLTRARVRAEAAGARFLNLFAYTGAFTVYAAAGGARTTTSVDLSNTYLDWAARNLALNLLAGAQHALVRADALAWLDRAARGAERWDLVVLDPPPFSTSKGMRGTFDVQRDHLDLLRATLAVVAPGGTLYFSTNYRRFRLDPRASALGSFEELTPASLPPDVQRADAHRCWRVQAGGGNGVRGAHERPASSSSPRRPGRRTRP